MSTFKEWNQQQRDQLVMADRLREAVTRRWVLDPTLLVPYRKEPVEFVFYVASHPVEDGERPTIGVTGTSHTNAMEVPAKLLRRIAAVKQLYENWATGEIAFLPTHCPPEILALP